MTTSGPATVHKSEIKQTCRQRKITTGTNGRTIRDHDKQLLTDNGKQADTGNPRRPLGHRAAKKEGGPVCCQIEVSCLFHVKDRNEEISGRQDLRSL